MKPEIPPKPADGIKPPNANATMNENQQVQNPVQKKKNGHWGLVMAALIVGTPAAIYVALKYANTKNWNDSLSVGGPMTSTTIATSTIPDTLVTSKSTSS